MTFSNEVAQRDDLTETERNVLARYFGMGKGSEIISHPPHATIGMHRHAFDHLIELGLLKVEPFNQYDVKRITCTEEAANIGFERMKENMRNLFATPGSSDLGGPARD